VNGDISKRERWKLMIRPRMNTSREATPIVARASCLCVAGLVRSFETHRQDARATKRRRLNHFAIGAVSDFETFNRRFCHA